MKHIHIILWGIFALLFVACTDEENNPDAPQIISFVSQTSSYATRINQEGDQWLSGDQIGTYMLETGSHTPLANSVNVVYTTETGGASATFTSSSGFTFPEDGSKVDFIGYYPYSSAVADFVYPINLANQSAGSAAHDLMRATSRSGYSRISETAVDMNFSHQLSKVVFKFTNTEGEVIDPSQLLIKGMNTTANFKLTTATLENESAVADITPYKAAQGAFEAIVIPTDDISTHTIAYTIDGELHSWNLTDTENTKLTTIEAGYKYTFTLTISATDTSVKVEVDGSSVAPWENGGSGEGSAGFTKNYTLFPVNNATGTYKDTYLKLTFTGETPEIGTNGSIKVYRADNHTLVDEINMADTQTMLKKDESILNTKMDILWAGDDIKRYRIVNYNPVTIDGNTATIKLHFNKLDYNTTYYVVIDNNVIKHSDFQGIRSNSEWVFTTKESPAKPSDAANTVTVGGDDSQADFRTIQAAMDFLVNNTSKDEQKTVYIYDGIYEELLFLRGVNNVTIKGQSREGVIIRYDNYDSFNTGTGGSASVIPQMGVTIDQTVGGRSIFLIETVDKLLFETLTLINTHEKVGSLNHQAETLYANNDGKAVAFINCNLESCQDTVNLKGFCWFYNCLVAGDVDFIWGSPAVALFEKCEIRSVNDGYIVQSRTAENNLGFVFLDCDLTTTGKAERMFLCRTTGESKYSDNISLINCKLDKIYSDYGWGLASGNSGNAPTPSVATLENGYKIYGCTDLSGNVLTATDINNHIYSYELTSQEYQTYFSNSDIILSAYGSDLTFFRQ